MIIFEPNFGKKCGREAVEVGMFANTHSSFLKQE
jgi:hypothetical protein